MNLNQLKRNYKKPEENKNLSLVRSGIFYGLQYVAKKVETVSINRGIVVTPNFTFYDNNTKVMIDFSDYKNIVKESELLDFWKLATKGITFAVDNAESYDSINAETYTLSGSYVFNKIENLIIFADVSSVGTLSTSRVLYTKKAFNNTPSFTLASIDSKIPIEKKTKIINTLGINTKNSFSYLGAVVGDYIQLQKFNTAYEILEYSVDSEGKEIVIISGQITEEDRISQPTFIGILVKKLNEADNVVKLDDSIIGSCSIQDNGVILRCFNNQTQPQCSCRNESQQTTIFTPQGICVTAATKLITTANDLTDIQVLVKTVDSLSKSVASVSARSMNSR